MTFEVFFFFNLERKKLREKMTEKYRILHDRGKSGQEEAIFLSQNARTIDQPMKWNSGRIKGIKKIFFMQHVIL